MNGPSDDHGTNEVTYIEENGTLDNLSRHGEHSKTFVVSTRMVLSGTATGSETSLPETDSSPLTVPDDLVLCPMCQGPSVSPRLLPCYQTICSSCLEKHIQSQITNNNDTNTFTCPLCSCPTKLPHPKDSQLDHPNYADRFEPDAFVEKLSNVLSAFKECKTCDLCKRRNIQKAASDWCMECLDAMCQECVKVHLSGKTTRDHTVVSLEELRKLSLASIMRRGVAQTCRKHPGETVRFYCMDCGVTVCVQCLTISHRKCENCVPLDDAMTSMGDAIADVMVRLQSVSGEGGGGGESESDTSVFQSGAQVLEESVKDAEEKIRSLANDLRQAITDKEQELLERLHSVASQLQEK
ncbi:E3 ubiquitin-protein ligase TRIM33, partial [Elysia marginata]